ncbi:MAG: serine/threonine-protein phosphatase [Candidatus Latescibacterota bacterium]|nr:MAG: serine/threonine-protein phosphatase [Candidatus Latescibacterota bacterium]
MTFFLPKSANPVLLLGNSLGITSHRRDSRTKNHSAPAPTLEAALDTRLFINEVLCPGEVVLLGSGTAAVYTARTPDESHEKNEDAAAVIKLEDGSAVLAVADGVGGSRGGDQASSLALKTLQQAIKTAIEEDRELRWGILNGFEMANQAVIDMAIGAATTLAAVEIDGDSIRPYHAGDSTIIVVGQRGKVKTRTVAHSPVGYAVEGGFLDEDAAMNHKDRHLISNSIGAPDMRIEVGPVSRLARHDTILLASDGLSDNLNTDEIVERIRKGPLETAVASLAARATDRMLHPNGGHPSKPDDLTMILFRRNS